MAEILKIGNGIVTPLTYETMEEAEKGTGKMIEAMKRGELKEGLPLEEWLRQARKYYI